VGPFRQKIEARLNLTGEPVVEVPVEGNIVSDMVLVGRGWDPERGVLTLDTVSGRDGAKADLFLLVAGPDRGKVHPTVKAVKPDVLKVTVGKATELANSQVRIPLTLEIPPGSRPALHLGGAEGTLGEILFDTGHPEAKTLKMRVRFAIGE
jgi:hypothetical protein